MSSCELEEGRMVANIESNLKLDKYRWVIICIYGIYCGVNFSQFLQFTIIANITERYYDVGNLTTDSTSLVFMAAFIILFVPIGHFIEKNTLKTTAVVSTGMTVIGTLIKLFAVQKDRFYLNIISQSICGIAQVFMLSIPSKVANTWFGAGEVSTACAVGVTWTQIGLALGALLPTLMVPNVKDDAEVAAGFTSLFILDNIASITVFIVVLFFFRSGPDSPPSQSQAFKMNNNKEKEIEYIGSFGKLLQEKDFLLVLVCFGASYGNWNSMGILFNEIYLNFFPNITIGRESVDILYKDFQPSEKPLSITFGGIFLLMDNGKYLGILVLVGILSGGVFGTLIFGYILDETHQYKKVSFCVMLLNCIFWICLSISFQLQSEIGSFIFIPAYGFTSGSLMVITYEFAIETSYPNPEELSTGLMNAVIYLFAICNVVILEIVFKFAGILAGQIWVALDYFAYTLLILCISSDLKRRKANLLELPLKNYGSSDE